jgi:DNA-binding CsgD family transcriptional regulator/PAS domain-containing protein
MLPSTDELSNLLGILYDAAADASLWPAFLQRLANITHSDSAALLLHDVAHDHHAVSVHSGADPEMLRLYGEYYGQRDVWLLKALSSAGPAYIGTSEQLCSFSELKQTEFFNDLLARYDIAHAMWSMAKHSPSQMTNLGIYRDVKKGAFGETDLAFLKFVAPHVQRAFRLHFQFSQLKGRGEGLGTALDLMPVGIILLGPKGEIVLMNRAAAQFISAHDGLQADRYGLRAERPTESAVLEKLIAEAAGTSLGKGLEPAGAVSVSRKLGPPLHVLLTPVRNLKAEGLIPVCAVAFIHDPSQQARPVPCILRDLFGLTPAESRVALLLADGRTPGDIGQVLGVASSTMKSHLSSIYGKTSTSGQVPLVRLLTQLSLKIPPVERSSA